MPIYIGFVMYFLTSVKGKNNSFTEPSFLVIKEREIEK